MKLCLFGIWTYNISFSSNKSRHLTFFSEKMARSAVLNFVEYFLALKAYTLIVSLRMFLLLN